MLGWTTAARVVRSSVITAKEQDYVAAARMLGAGNGRIMWRHILPNALAPAIVVLTIALGSFIAAEATLSFLGIGLKAPTISWGIDIAAGRVHMRESATAAGRPVGLPRADRAGLHHARRRDPRRLRPEAAVEHAMTEPHRVTHAMTCQHRRPSGHLLEVRDLHVEFRTREGVAKVDQRRLVPPGRRARRWPCSASPAPASR